VGPLEPGTYRIANPAWTSVPFTFSVPDGWTGGAEGFVTKGDGDAGTTVLFTSWIVTHVYRDPCQWRSGLEPVTGVAGLAQALTGRIELESVLQPRTVASQPVGGKHTTLVRLAVPADYDPSACSEGHLRLWPDPGGAQAGGRPIFPGQSAQIFIFAGDRVTFVLLLLADEDADPRNLVELDQIVRSVDFEQ
jgi:hypothetical protein